MFGGSNKITLCVRPTIVAAVVTVLLVVAVVVVAVVKSKDQSCHAGDLQGLAMNCGRYVKKAGPTTTMVDPSQGCCDVIKGTDVMCVCQHIPKGIEQMLDMGKVAYVAQFCGKPLPPLFNCTAS